MEIRDFAIRILSADTIEEKLLTPKILTDREPGPPLFWDEPTRPPGMQFTRKKKSDKLPSTHYHHDPDKRAICLHRFAGHELLAVEMMAYTLLAAPHAPKHFRRGVANTLKEEQGHVKLYMDRMEEMGIQFGDLPLYRHFWVHTPHLNCPLNYVSIMCLTLEMANLDFAPLYRDSFAKHGDEKSSLLMKQIFEDEIEHVQFGWHWMNRLRPKIKSSLEEWQETLAPTLLSPKRAKGLIFKPEGRAAAGLPQDWIEGIRTA